MALESATKQQIMTEYATVEGDTLTANVNAQDLDRFKAAGLNDLMLKPFEPAQLCAQIEALLAHGQSGG